MNVVGRALPQVESTSLPTRPGPTQRLRTLPQEHQHQPAYLDTLAAALLPGAYLAARGFFSLAASTASPLLS